MTTEPFILDFDPEIGKPTEILPGLRRITAPNASPMTFRGTNTYLLGEVEIAVIDPGPDDPVHLAAILNAAGRPEKITHIFVTHSHVDHSPLSRKLSQITGAPVLALGDSWKGRSRQMANLADQFDLGGGEGVDQAFSPDIELGEEAVTEGREWTLRAIATPGHFSNHMCFAWSEPHALFSGDHVMSWATTLVSPPDGDLTAFMKSLAKLAKRSDDQVYLPGHGERLDDPHRMVDHLTTHRRARESQILEVLKQGPAKAEEMTQRIYQEIPEALMPMANRNVFAHLLDLTERNLAQPLDKLSVDAVFRLTE